MYIVYTVCTCQFIAADIDECASSPCRNGGTCVDDVNSYQCVCAAGYTANLCQSMHLDDMCTAVEYPVLMIYTVRKAFLCAELFAIS